METKPIVLCREINGYTPAVWNASGELIGVICPQSGVVNIANQINELLTSYFPDGTLLPNETNASFGWADGYLDLYTNYTYDGEKEHVRLTWVRMYR